jgi:hypothetical protein
MNISAKSSETCMMYTEDNWLVYQSHFLYVNFLTVQVLQTDKHKSALNMFTQSAIKITVTTTLHRSKSKKPFYPKT